MYLSFIILLYLLSPPLHYVIDTSNETTISTMADCIYISEYAYVECD